MKKLISIMLLLTAVVSNNYASYHYYTQHNPSTDEYYIDRKIEERKINKALSPNKGQYAGIITRAGYAFNYDAFTYGASIIYHFDNPIGVSVGFDGYYIPNKTAIISNGQEIRISDYSLPLWDVRGGLLLGKYFAIGGLAGKWTIDNPNLINMKENAWFISNKESKVMYGGWATFILPIGKYFGLNVDFAVTNKTGFNVAAGINITIPVK